MLKFGTVDWRVGSVYLVITLLSLHSCLRQDAGKEAPVPCQPSHPGGAVQWINSYSSRDAGGDHWLFVLVNNVSILLLNSDKFCY